MRYLALSDLCHIFGLPDEQALLAQLDPCLQQAEHPSDEQWSRMRELGVDAVSLFRQLEVLKSDSGLVFHQWIQQSKHLAALLRHQQLDACDFRTQIAKEHFLFPAFSKWISPLLTPLLLEQAHDLSNAKALLLASYLFLLKDDDQLLVQDKLHRFFTAEWEQAWKQSQTLKEEKDLIRSMAPVFSDERIACLNLLNKAFYHARVDLIDQAMLVLKHPACTYRAAYWLVGQLRKLDLNPDHRQQIEDMHQSVKIGDGRYRRRESLLSRNSGFALQWKRYAIYTLSAAVLGWLFYFIFTYQQDDSVELHSAFEQFTPQERRHLDSLIRTMEPDAFDSDQLRSDQGTLGLHLTPVSGVTVDRQTFANTRVNAFISDCLKALEAQERGDLDSCVPYRGADLERLQFHNFAPLSENTGKAETFIQNSSPDQVLLVVFKDDNSAPVYAHLLLPSTDVRFKVQPGQRIFVLPGRDLAPFQARKDARNLPGPAYQHHFYHNDMALRNRLLWAYQFKGKLPAESRMLLNRSDENEFLLIDLNEVLEN